MADNAAKIAYLDQKITLIRAEMESLQHKLNITINRRQSLREDDNQVFLTDIDWLINNPEEPGQHKAMKDWIFANFGGEYKGVSTFGYNLETGQCCFNLQFTGYDGEDHTDNIKKFLAMTLHLFKPHEDFVNFTYATGQYSGLQQLMYKPDDQTWWTGTTTYGRSLNQNMHTDLDAAIEYAKGVAASVDD